MTNAKAISEPWITTHSGRQFFPLSPREEDIDIQDIAHHLSLINRFTGATREPYSVAEHSVRVSWLLPTTTALWGLLHDASEAYILDMSTPLKKNTNLGAEYQKIEKGIMEAVCRKFGLTEEEPPEVKTADQIMLVTEKRDLLVNNPFHPVWEIAAEPIRSFIHPVPWRQAKAAFLERFVELTTTK